MIKRRHNMDQWQTHLMVFYDCEICRCFEGRPDNMINLTMVCL